MVFLKEFWNSENNYNIHNSSIVLLEMSKTAIMLYLIHGRFTKSVHYELRFVTVLDFHAEISSMSSWWPEWGLIGISSLQVLRTFFIQTNYSLLFDTLFYNVILLNMSDFEASWKSAHFCHLSFFVKIINKYKHFF